MSTLTIARDQLSNLIRSRFLFVILFLGVAIIGLFIMWLAFLKHLPAMGGGNGAGPGADPVQMSMLAQVMAPVLQAALNSFSIAIGTLLALSLMCYSVSTEVSKGTARMILSRPVRRYELILGKWLGSVRIALLYSLLMSLLVSIYTRYAFDRLISFVPIAIMVGFFKAVMVGSVGMVLSIFLRPIPAAMIAYFAAGETFLFVATRFCHGIVAKLVELPFYILPSYKALDTYSMIISGTTLSAREIAYRIAYSLLVSAVMLVVASILFDRRNLAGI
jgi:ABC-type transport system involved in multi-copper enzyme maturation permease subunit